ncbi:MAG: OFA family MFS transporter [Christensenellales bacterium]
MKAKAGNRYAVLAAGMAVQLCTGIIYMWSVFQKFLVEQRGLDAAQVTFVFSVMLAMFVVGIVVGGRIQDKRGPRIVVFFGSLLFGVGMFLTSFVFDASPVFIYLFYGVMAGFGVGAAYNTSISCAQKWFMDKRGFATGMIVCAFGFSVVIFTPLANSLLKAYDAPATFRIFSIAFLVICLSASALIKNPPEGYVPKGYTPPAAGPAKQGLRPSEMLRTPQFYFLTLSMMFITPSYFILNPLLMILGEARGLGELAMLGVMITGIASSSGRLIAPWISDKIGRKATILGLAAITLLSVVVLISAHRVLFLAMIALVAFAYGGTSGVYPAFTSDLYGTKYAGANYGCVMVGFGASAIIFPFISTAVNTAGAASGDYTLSFIIAAATCIVAAIMVSCVKLVRKKGLEAGK